MFCSGFTLSGVNDHPVLREAAKLPLIIKEKDIDYQLYRIILFDKLLEVETFEHSQSFFFTQLLNDLAKRLLQFLA